jgi:hypothetical protein
MLCFPFQVPMVPRGDAALRRPIGNCIDDLGVPIGGQRLVDYDDRDFTYSRHVPTTDPQFFARSTGGSAGESLIGGTRACMVAQKITRSDYPLCTARNA